MTAKYPCVSYDRDYDGLVMEDFLSKCAECDTWVDDILSVSGRPTCIRCAPKCAASTCRGAMHDADENGPNDGVRHLVCAELVMELR